MLVYTPGFFTGSEQNSSSIKSKDVDSINIVKSVQLVQSLNPAQKVTKEKSIGSVCQDINSVKIKIVPLKFKKHRRGKRNSVQAYTKNFKWVGNNVAGATSKWAAIKRLVRVKSPAIVSLQETKFQVSGKHKLDGYIIYEHLRTHKTAGGGILLAVVKDLNPALVSDGGDDVEALTVDISVKKMQISCSTAYGPQEKDPKEKKQRFWKYLDGEAKRADNEGKGFILQGDLNAWLGHTFISDDPRKQNENGRMMEDFLKSNNLTVVNGLKLCKGLFTRVRKCKNIEEKSILDFFVVCNKVLLYVTNMAVDEEKENIPSNYTQVRRGGKVVDSDHMVIEINLNIRIPPTRPARVIIYNFKNQQGRDNF